MEIMPDPFGIGRRALDGLRDRPGLRGKTSLIGMEMEGSADDSLTAAQYLRRAGADCLVVLGGDGTCRVVAKESGEVPILAISSGTNNVVPTFVEGTVAGAAAAHVAHMSRPERDQVCRRHKRLLVGVNGAWVDQALVEVALVSGGFVGARAIWEADRLRQVFVTRAQPFTIGVSSIVGMIHPVSPGQPFGASVAISEDGFQVMAPLAPGAFVPVGVEQVDEMVPGARYAVEEGTRPAVLALDGEREVVLYEGDEAEVMLDLDGPWMVDVEEALELAVEKDWFVRERRASG